MPPDLAMQIRAVVDSTRCAMHDFPERGDEIRARGLALLDTVQGLRTEGRAAFREARQTIAEM
jgi:hypothetical protein